MARADGSLVSEAFARDCRISWRGADSCTPLRHEHRADAQIGTIGAVYGIERGWGFDAIIAKGHSAADDVTALVRSGGLRHVSLGFVPTHTEEIPLSSGGKLLVRHAVDVVEVSLVSAGAYGPFSRVTDLRVESRSDFAARSSARRRETQLASLGINTEQIREERARARWESRERQQVERDELLGAANIKRATARREERLAEIASRHTVKGRAARALEETANSPGGS